MALVEQDQEPEQRSPSKGEQSQQTEQPAARKPGNEDKADKAKPSRLTAMRRHPWLTAVGIVALTVAVVVGVIWWLNARHYVSTNDAYIDARTVAISPQVSGLITAVPVTDNQDVKKGAPLVDIDPRDYKVAVEQAKASLAQAKAKVANLGAQIDAQQANLELARKKVTEAQAALKYAQQQNQRAQRLVK